MSARLQHNTVQPTLIKVQILIEQPAKSSDTSALAMGRLLILILDTLLIGMVGASVQCIAKSGSPTANLWDYAGQYYQWANFL